MAVIAACLQDSIVSFDDMDFLAPERRFVLVVNRFRWENCDESRRNCGAFERVSCGITFEHVRAVHLRNLDRSDREAILSLLTIEVGEGRIDLIFAGGGVIRLDVDGIRCFLKDRGEPWPTKWRPAHPIEETEKDRHSA